MTQVYDARTIEAAVKAVSAMIVDEDRHEPTSAWDSGRCSAFCEAVKIIRALPVSGPTTGEASEPSPLNEAINIVKREMGRASISAEDSHGEEVACGIEGVCDVIVTRLAALRPTGGLIDGYARERIGFTRLLLALDAFFLSVDERHDSGGQFKYVSDWAAITKLRGAYREVSRISDATKSPTPTATDGGSDATVAEFDRTPAQFFFEVGFGACWAEAFIRNGEGPFPLTDGVIERAWEIAGEAHEDPAEFDHYLALADGHTPLFAESAKKSGSDAIGETVEKLRELLAKVDLPLVQLQDSKGFSRIYSAPEEPHFRAGDLLAETFGDGDDLIVEAINALPTLLTALEQRDTQPSPGES